MSGIATENGGSGVEFAFPTSRRRVLVKRRDTGDLKYDAASLNSPTTPKGTPILERIFQLEEQMSALEGKYSPRALAAELHSPKSPFSLIGSPTTPSSVERRCRPAKSVLQETEERGTLIERVQVLEKRLSQHSMDLEKAFSSGRFGSMHFGSNRFEPNTVEPEHLQEARDHDDHEISHKATMPSVTSETPALEKPAEEAIDVVKSETAAAKDPTEGQDQKREGSEGGAVANSVPEPIKKSSSLADKEDGQKPLKEATAVSPQVSLSTQGSLSQLQPLEKKGSLRKKQHFKNIRERMHRYFGQSASFRHKEAP